MSEDCVKVAVRVRPLISSEIQEGYQNCISVVPGEPQIQMNDTKDSFTYNYVFGSDVNQEEVYNSSVKGMIEEIFNGYNITILAYGQTGSGKTHLMGTSYSNEAPESTGIIPRAVRDIFETISSREHDDWSFRVTVSFMELYKEKLYDLLGDKTRKDCLLDIRKDTNGMKVVGLTEHEVKSSEDVLHYLALGSQGSATEATEMNAHSSRSHTIFTIMVSQYKEDSNSATTSKLHLVDLAGSESSNKTQATGERFQESVSINKSLLALGNVVSDLGDNAAHINYRESKLTRLLEDSLGINSITLIIACVSPANHNSAETLSTLRFADRARKMKNKPIVNRDPIAAEINRLNSLVEDLQKTNQQLSEKLRANHIDSLRMHDRAESDAAAGVAASLCEHRKIQEMENDLKSLHSENEQLKQRYANVVAERNLAMTRNRELELAPQISLEEHQKILEEELSKCRKQGLEGQGRRSPMEGRRRRTPTPSPTTTIPAAPENKDLESDESPKDDREKDPDYKDSLRLPLVRTVLTRKKSFELLTGKCYCKNKRCNNNDCMCHNSAAICDNECGCDPIICENRTIPNQICDLDDDPFDRKVKKMRK